MKISKRIGYGLIGAVALLAAGIAGAQVGPYAQVTTPGASNLMSLIGSGPGFVYITASNLRAWILGGGGSAILPVPNGGTGKATLTSHGVVVGEAASAVGITAAGTTGQLLQGATGADPAFSSTLSGSYTLTGALNSFGSTTPAHIATAQTTPPALTSCGTGSPAVTGTDTAGIVTMGTSATGCVITFNVAYTGTPYCVVSWIATPLASQSYVTSNAAITLTQTSTSGNKAQYICVATAGG